MTEKRFERGGGIPDTYWNTIDRIVGPAKRDEFSSIGQQPTREALEDFVLEHGKNVADVGCNTGVEGVRLFERGFDGRYTGVDSNPDALGHAGENLADWSERVDLCCADIHNIPLASRTFDLVFTRGVIEHLESYENALREVSRLTSDYLVVAFFLAPHRWRDKIRMTEHGYYLNRYNHAAFMEYVEGLGFDKGRIAYKGHDHANYVFRRR